ncbi:hypothetical protein E3E26_08115 [Thermococcus sp. LS1]|uniref:hypothetical protein n=1 Tax=Thermococcus sp. LS1 TaxID=1638259 RepID=UPI00143C268A|nr:hypothetical protein [Thermococcus sp. LS1]NJD99743.1 hypothetical protein [Thermococcus sp. LS1]
MRAHSIVSVLIAFLLLTTLLPPIKAYSTAWCESCHQFIVENDGVFAYNGSTFQDLTWELQAKGLTREEFLDFVQTISVANAGNITLLYFFPYDSLYMAIYNGDTPVVFKPVLGYCVNGIWDFVYYNGNIFFVASLGTPHFAADSVIRLDPETLNVTEEWNLAWDARERIAPENATLIPYAWVRLGLDDHERLWARVDLIMPNTTLYYLYNGTNFTPVNASPKLHIPKPKASFRIEVRRGVTYSLPYLLPKYTPTRYFLVKNETERDVTGEVKALAYSVEPLRALYGFWDDERKEWVVSFGMYGLTVTYAVRGSCRAPLDVSGLPLAAYKGSYVILSNGTLSWKNHTVKTPIQSEYWLDNPNYSRGYVSVRVYQKSGHQVIAFPWEVIGNGSIRRGFIAYEVTGDGFVIFNTTDERELGQNLVPLRVIPEGKGDSKWNNVTGTLIISEENGTAFLITEDGRVSVNFTVARKTWSVIVGNGTFLMVGLKDAYVVPPYDKPVSVLRIPSCETQGKGGNNWSGVVTPLLAGILAIAVFATLLLIRKR